SASRVMVDITDDRHLRAAGQIREWLATYQKNEDLIAIGAYNQGANPKIDKAIQMQSRIESFLRQGRNEIAGYGSSLEQLFELTELE
ncbi:MAG: flagellum-specific synthase FliL, partial [Pseudomonadota bacterium]